MSRLIPLAKWWFKLGRLFARAFLRFVRPLMADSYHFRALYLLIDTDHLTKEQHDILQNIVNPQVDIDRVHAVSQFALQPPVRQQPSRYDYQRHLIHYPFTGKEEVLDVGGGSDPFPFATVVVDRYLKPTEHRSTIFDAQGKPALVADIHDLPFESKSFDFVVCSHVLEHVEDPIQACVELQRVAKAGYIETPTFMKDALFSWAQGMHRWYVVTHANHLIFFEYDERRAQGIRSNNWNKLILNYSSYDPLQTDFVENQDIFNSILQWEGHFRVTVYYLDGTVRTSFPTE